MGYRVVECVEGRGRTAWRQPCACGDRMGAQSASRQQLIYRGRKADQLEDNIPCDQLRLSDDDVRQLDAAVRSGYSLSK